MARGVELINEMLPEANRVKRQPVPASHLTVGLQCGGCDGYSGISANPALGAAVDRLVRHGGTAILCETPEIYGAEHLLTRRAVSPEVGEKLLARIALVGALHRAQRHGDGQQPLARQQGRRPDDDPGKEPGRDRQERHHATWSTWSNSRSRSTAHGFVYMDTPGYDPVSATGQVAGGANLICFTTGRGSAYGCAPSPVAEAGDQHGAVAPSRQDDIDIDCGDIVDGAETVDEVGERIFELMLDTASGRTTKSELHGYGQNEFVPWQLGAVM